MELTALMGRAWESMDGGGLRNFWQLGKLGQVWEKYDRNGEVRWKVGGGVRGGVERCVGGGVGKCVWGVERSVGSVLGWGEVWGEWVSMRRCGKCGGGV